MGLKRCQCVADESKISSGCLLISLQLPADARWVRQGDLSGLLPVWRNCAVVCGLLLGVFASVSCGRGGAFGIGFRLSSLPEVAADL